MPSGSEVGTAAAALAGLVLGGVLVGDAPVDGVGVGQRHRRRQSAPVGRHHLRRTGNYDLLIGFAHQLNLTALLFF